LPAQRTRNDLKSQTMSKSRSQPLRSEGSFSLRQ
jgi:hypothetical protein